MPRVSVKKDWIAVHFSEQTISERFIFAISEGLYFPDEVPKIFGVTLLLDQPYMAKYCDVSHFLRN